MTQQIIVPQFSTAIDDLILPREWRRPEDIPSLEQMCDHIKRDTLFSDVFFFPETNNWENHEDGSFEPTFDFQGVMDEAIEERNVIWIQGSRGSSKSSRTARAVDKYLLRNANQACKIIGPSFRQSKESYKYCLKYIRQNRGIDNLLYRLDQDIPPDNIKEGHEQMFEITNGSSCQALPAGDGSTLRGQRATVLWLEEFYLADRQFVTSHVKPFLNVQRGNKQNKLIYVTTSYYQDCYAYEVLMEIAKAMKRGRKSYYIIDISLDDVAESERLVLDGEPEGLMPHFPAEWEHINDQLDSGTDAVTGILSDDMEMTFYNKWIKQSANFFRTDKIAESQRDDVPVLEAMPKKGWTAPFVLGVDPAGQGSDFAAMAVGSLPGNDHRHLHAIWKWAKQSPEQIAGHIHKMVDLYGMKWIVMDKTGAMGYDIANKCTSKMQLIDDVWQERIPIGPWDHPDEGTFRAHIVLTKPSDEKMISGFLGPRVDSTISGEIELKNALLLDIRTRFLNGQISCAARALDSDYASDSDQGITKGELLDNIREGLAQFPKIDKIKLASGAPKVDGRGNFYFTRPAKDDGAFATAYMSWCANIVYKQIGKKPKPEEPGVFWDSTPTAAQEEWPENTVRPRF